MNQPYDVLLWDFGDTLCDERVMWREPAGFEGWIAAWKDSIYESEWANDWMLGKMSLDNYAQIMSKKLSIPTPDIVNHMERCCRNITFFPNAWSLAQRHVCRQAIVTVNPDIFSNVIVPHYDLDQVFDVIVTSWEEGTVDKGVLCAEACKRLGHANLASACLIDNKDSNLPSWEERGGAVYHFQGDDSFARDFGLI